MQSIFKPFVAVESPVRYFLVLFIMSFGASHIADDFRFLFGDGKHSDLSNVFYMAISFSVLVFISRFLAQQKAKRRASATAKS